MAAAKGDSRVLESLLAKGGAETINCATDSQSTPLMVACWAGNYKNTKVLLDRGALKDLKDQDGWTALHVATRWGKHECVQALVQSGCELNPKCDKGLTPLDFAVAKNKKETALYLYRQGAKSYSKSIPEAWLT